MVISADGADVVAQQSRIMPLTFWDYQHHALVATIRTEDRMMRWRGRFSMAKAFWPFYRLAIRIFSRSLVTVARGSAADAAQVEDKLNRAFDVAFDNSGLCKVESARQVFRLTGRYARQFAAHRLALVGNAAHTIHPLAGQGVNLGFMDAAELIAELKRLHRQGKASGSTFICVAMT
ncbi:FAD-dependent monooxygenase [Shigella flexneri]